MWERFELVGFGGLGLCWVEGAFGDLVDVGRVEVAQLLEEAGFLGGGDLLVECLYIISLALGSVMLCLIAGILLCRVELRTASRLNVHTKTCS